MSNVQNMICKYPLSLSECKRSNILVTGTNQTGKSRLSMALSDILMKHGFQILVFDNVGHWRQQSSVRTYFEVSPQTMKYILPKRSSLIYDISLLLPSYQKEFCENVLNDLWNYRVQQKPNHWVFLIFEEFQLYAKNVRGNVSQNILRTMSVGANHNIRCLGITPDLSLIDCAFIRLTNQRYHFRLGNEPNAKRRFNAYYGSDYTRVCRELDVGSLIFYLNEKLKIYSIPLFRSRSISRPYIEPQKPKEPNIWHKIKVALSGSEEEEENEVYDYEKEYQRELEEDDEDVDFLEDW